jgi:DNA-binding MarR family transcriptional regulator
MTSIRLSEQPVETAARAWQGMRALALERYDRRKEVCEALGMSFIRVKAVRRLAAGPLTMRQLADWLAIDKPYATLVVDDLERRGLVERLPHPTDRRRRIAHATPAGLAAAEQADHILGEPPAALLDLAPDDLATLDRIIKTLANANH